jgi:N-formylglutamate deformylase
VEVFRFRQGIVPLLVSIPHAGRTIPADIAETMSGEGRATPDTDFFVDRLYAFAESLGASVLAANFSRYVVDLNRPPDDAALYPGQLATGLAPKFSFDGKPLYREGKEPVAEDVRARVAAYWNPYHAKISEEIVRLKERFAYALLWDAHSIKSRVPSLFAGRLPDWNIGTNGGLSCTLAIEPAFRDVLAEKNVVFNGRFQGGFITRNYGKPAEGVHAVQLELVQAAYMDEAANRYADAKAGPTAALIQRLIEALLELPLP